MQSRDLLGSLVNAYPRETMKLVVLVAASIWMTLPAIVGLLLYLYLQQVRARDSIMIWLVVLVTLPCVCWQLYLMKSSAVQDVIRYGWAINKISWHAFLGGQYTEVFQFVVMRGFNYLLGVPALLALLMGLVDKLPISSHQQTLIALQRGKLNIAEKQLSAKEIKQGLNKLVPYDEKGTVLGVSVLSGKAVILDDQAVNQVVMVLGTTGAGKTITLRRFIDRAIYKRYPLIIVDGKPSDENVAWVKSLAEARQQPFYGFNCGNFQHYNPLAHGGHTELKDKIMSLKDQWENDYYRSIAEDYLQTTFEVLLSANIPFDLSTIVKCLNFNELATIVPQVNDKSVMERVKGLAEYERKDMTGLQAHLSLLIHSELGQYFTRADNMFNLKEVLENNGVVYFALPALRFPTFSKVLGKLVINDIKTVIDRYEGNKRIFAVFDEFSVFAGDQVLNLVNMGRGKGMHAIFGTQGLADLDKVEPQFNDQILNCTNTIICHRLNDQNSAESVANWVGTRDAFTVTAQLASDQGSCGMGSVRVNKEFLVHPDVIKQGLKTGEAFVISKVGGFTQEKALIKYL